MDSHRYNLNLREFLRLITPIILLVVAFAGVMHSGAKLNLWPRPRPALDMDRTILFHQADAARTNEEVKIVFIGDSSCLMDVSARMASERLRQPALNLGTFSYLGLRDYATLLESRYAARPSQNETIVLLMHPEALRRPVPDSRYGRILSDYLNGADHCETATIYHRLSCGLGLEIVRGRVLVRLLPQPLRGRYGEFYGFTSDLDRYLTKEGGSLLDVESKAFSGNAEYRLALSLEAQSREFRTAIPAGAKLLVGITPVPETFAPPGYATQYNQMLNQWSMWLKADATLTALPPTLPNSLFANVTHLNPEGVRVYTEFLVESISPK